MRRSTIAPPLAVATLLAGLVACDTGSRPNPIRTALAEEPGSAAPTTAAALRFAARGGQVALYRLPTLDPVDWQAAGADGPIEHIVGFAGDDDLVYALDARDRLVALDLAAARVRVVDSAVALAILGPDEVPYVVHENGTVATIQHRSPVPWTAQFAEPPVALWAATRNRLVGVLETDSGRILTMLAPGQDAVHQPIPSGALAVPRWGDLVVVATDSGLVALDPSGAVAPRVLGLEPPPTVVAFSPSAHRLYAVSQDGRLVAVDRFEWKRLEHLDLPGEPTALRMDPNGRLALVRAAGGDSAWVVDLVHWRLVGVAAGAWGADLPAVAPDGTVLVRRGGDVVALRPDSLVAAGRAEAARGDRWLVATWLPRRAELEPPAETEARAADSGRLLYVQVSSTHNEAWAQDLAENLRRAGIAARVLPPSADEELFRVVLGPYGSRAEAEETGRKLGLPFWIFTADSSAATR